jgi:hypothetical protein
MDNYNLEIEMELLKKDFEYLKLDAKNKDINLKDGIDKLDNKLDDAIDKLDNKLDDAIDKIHNKLDDKDERIHRIITEKFDEKDLKFKNKYYTFFYSITGAAILFAITVYKTFIK